jgi:hypothetical protein
MPNPIKYSTSAQTLALKKGNFWIGTGDVGKGPTSTTDYYNGITPPSGGYTIYLNKASGGPSIYTAANDSQLISLTNTISYITTNYISNGGNFADGTISPFNSSYSDPGGVARVVSIANDKPYAGSTSTNALEFNYNAGSAFSVNGLLTVGQTYTFSFWAKVTSGTSFSIYWNNQNGSGETNNWSSGGFTVTTSWKRYSQVFTYNAARTTFYFYTRNQTVGTLAVFTEFQVSVGSAPCGPGLTTAAESINWFLTQTDKMVFNVDYPAIVTNGLILNFDAGFNPSITSLPTNIVGGGYNSYTPIWYDLGSGGNNGSLINGPTFSSADGGSIVFDGVDDYTSITLSPNSSGSICFWYYYNANTAQRLIMGSGNSMIYCGGSPGVWHWYNWSGNYDFGGSWGNTSQWLYLCAIYQSTTDNSFYVNGNLAYSSSSYSITKGTTYNVAGGTYTPQNCRFATISTYNRALSAAEILQNFNAQKSRFGL